MWFFYVLGVLVGAMSCFNGEFYVTYFINYIAVKRRSRKDFDVRRESLVFSSI